MILSQKTRVLLAMLAMTSSSAFAQSHAHDTHEAPAKPSAERQVLYWYDPMYPQQRFDAPGPSPFMDMDLVPRYADPDSDGTTIRIDDQTMRSLGMRAVTVIRAPLQREIHASGVLGYDERTVTVIQARAEAWVEEVPPRAVDDRIEKGAVLARLLVPSWIAVQEEYLALRGIGDDALTAAAMQRMQLAGMPAELIAEVRRSGRLQSHWTLRSPVTGVVRELGLRQGMSLPAGTTLAAINGTERVWLEVALPEAQAGDVQLGQSLELRVPAFPGEHFEARVSAVLPEADAAGRVVRVRAEMDNPNARLRPGMTARVRLLAGEGEPVLQLPADAVIRGGRRDLVMLIEELGLYRPVEVVTGSEVGDRIEIREGLEEGQRIVGSAQFLLDSEASLRGVMARALDAPVDEEPLHEAEATLLYQDEDGLMLEHGPFESLNMPGMTMQFPLADGVELEGIEEGDRVRVWVRQDPDGIPVVRLEKLEEQP